MRRALDLKPEYDLTVVGGGVHGAAVAWEAALAGQRVCLVERDDFACRASANNLKIIHGGLRYMQTLDIGRSRAYAREQSRLMRWFPHLVRPLACVMPTDRHWSRSRWALFTGITMYQLTAATADLPRGRLLSRQDLQHHLPGDLPRGITGGALWYDAQVVNPERLVLSYALSARDLGADVCNHVEAERMLTSGGAITGLAVRDMLNSREYELRTRMLVDATGAVTDRPVTDTPARYLRAVNLVIGHAFGDCAVGMRAPDREDQRREARLLFLTPWRQRTIAGTWYFPDRPGARDVITHAELESCLADLGRLSPGWRWTPDDVKLIHIGRLPADGAGRLLDRPRVEDVSGVRGAIRLHGVKYSNARRVGQQVARRLGISVSDGERRRYGAEYAGLEQLTAAVDAAGGNRLTAPVRHRLVEDYGSNALELLAMIGPDATPEMLPGSNVLAAEVDHACEAESAFTLSDVLLRRTGLGALGPPAAETVDACMQKLAQRFGMSEQEQSAQRADLFDHYDRIVDDDENS